MLISLHKNATTTPATRLALQQATGTDRELAQQYGIGIGTVRKWRSRSTVHDASHTAHRLQTTLNAGQEELVIYLRSQLRLPLDDLLAVVREFIEPAMSRSALDRLLRRRGYSRLPVQPKPESEHKPFKAYEPGYVHVDVKYLPQMQDEDKRRYVFVAIDRATRWVFIDIKQHKTAASAKAFLAAVRKAAAFRIHTILTDNGKEFTDRLFGSRTRQPTGEHEFDQLCQALGIEHRLTKPRTPKTNGMVERFNGRISEVVRQTRFASAAELETTLERYLKTYNQQIPQRALNHLSPVQALKEWQKKKPELFKKRVYNQAGLDTHHYCRDRSHDAGGAAALPQAAARQDLAHRSGDGRGAHLHKAISRRCGKPELGRHLLPGVREDRPRGSQVWARPRAVLAAPQRVIAHGAVSVQQLPAAPYQQRPRPGAGPQVGTRQPARPAA